MVKYSNQVSNKASLNLFLHGSSCTCESERDGSDENSKVVLSVAVASFTLSIRTKLNMKVSLLCYILMD
jgi:hypothetical protein